MKTLYTIVPTADVDFAMKNCSYQCNDGFNRLSLDTTLTLFKFDFDDSLASSIFVIYEWYDKNEITLIMNTAAWLVI